jgi:hypothetical protein
MSAERHSSDGTTEAVIEVCPSTADAYGGFAAPAAQLGQANPSLAQPALLALTNAARSQLPETIVNSVSYSYSSDALALGDPFTVDIPNPRGIYTDKFLCGQTVKLYLKNPHVEGGTRTLKKTAIIVKRDQSCGPQGRTIHLDCADLGWHLANNDAPIWYVLQGTSLYRLCKDPNWIDPSWGIRGLDVDTATDRLIKQGLNQGRRERELELQNILGTFVKIQTEVGDSIAGTISEYARRENRLVNVSSDGYLQIYKPDYSIEPKFRIELHDLNDSSRNRNNVLDVRISEDITPKATHVICQGEQVGAYLAPNDPTDQNAARRRGDFRNQFALPFYKRKTFADNLGVFDVPHAKKAAQWAYERGIFESWQAVCVVRDHWQKPDGGSRAWWWESNELCTVDDTLNGIQGTFWISSVRCDRTMQGDRTTVTLRKPCFEPAFGRYPSPPKLSGSIKDYLNGLSQKTETGTANKVTKP